MEIVRGTEAPQLRGFSGRKKLYINVDHFLLNYKKLNPSSPLELLQLDLLTVTFHESMHTILRVIENNYNLSTPIDSKEAKVEEAGAYFEKSILTCCPDWIKTYI
ncbi:unnamed protein product [Rotaria sp. Silwood1]|nr:unnamed protein product [Rotaria sp. Silwood1]